MFDINTELVRCLIREQFPQWADLQIKPVEKSGLDNRTFHLGSEMSVRLPVDEAHAPQAEKEAYWLPKLNEYLSIPIPVPLAKGQPSDKYPSYWSVNKWLEGETLDYSNITDMNQLAVDLACFLKELEGVDPSDGPIAGLHNFHRGGSFSLYKDWALRSIENLQGLIDEKKYNAMIDTKKCRAIINLALQSEWRNNSVWIHGDMAKGNLLVKDGKLSGVIDFGIMGVGDPACDITMSWTFFDDDSRQIFIDSVGFDEDTVNRARGWAMWRALMSYDHFELNAEKTLEAEHVIDVLIREYDTNN